VAIVLLMATFSAATNLNYHHANDPRELHVLTTPDEGTRDALSALHDVAYHKSGHPLSTPLTVEAGLGATWMWYLRNWEDVRVANELSSEIDTPLVLASADQQHPALGDRYIGQDFVARTWWTTDMLGANEQPRWWLYRKSAISPVPVQKVIVWMQAKVQSE
jgi:hypothetical protein